MFSSPFSYLLKVLLCIHHFDTHGYGIDKSVGPSDKGHFYMKIDDMQFFRASIFSHSTSYLRHRLSLPSFQCSDRISDIWATVGPGALARPH